MSFQSPSYRTSLVSFLERMTKTDLRYLVGGGSWIVLGQAVSAISAFALAVAFANLVPPEVYGTYKYLISIAAMFSIFTLPGMATAISRTVALGNEEAIHNITRARVRFSFVGSAFALSGSCYYLLNGNSELAIAFFLIGSTLPFFDTTTTYLSYLTGKGRFDLQTRYHALTQCISVIVLVGALLFTDHIILILLAYFLPLIVARAVLYFVVTNTIPDKPNSSSADTALYGVHLTVMNILSTIAGQVDKILLWQLVGPAQVAVYTAAVAIPEQIKGPLKGLSDVVFPKFAQKTPTEIRRDFPLLLKKMGLYALVLFAVATAYIAIAPSVFNLFFTQYIESVYYSQILALSLVTNVSSVALAILAAQEKTFAQYVVFTVQPIITIGLLLFFVPTYGVFGAIISLVVSRFVSTAIFVGALWTVR